MQKNKLKNFVKSIDYYEISLYNVFVDKESKEKNKKEVIKMKIINTAKNGQAVMVSKSFDELTDAEIKMAGTDIELKDDVEDFRLQYNKKGELLHVAAGQLKDDHKEATADYDVIDAMTLLFGKKGTKEVVNAKKRYARTYGKKVTKAQIDAAKRVLA